MIYTKKWNLKENVNVKFAVHKIKCKECFVNFLTLNKFLNINRELCYKIKKKQ